MKYHLADISTKCSRIALLLLLALSLAPSLRAQTAMRDTVEHLSSRWKISDMFRLEVSFAPLGWKEGEHQLSEQSKSQFLGIFSDLFPDKEGTEELQYVDTIETWKSRSEISSTARYYGTETEGATEWFDVAPMLYQRKHIWRFGIGKLKSDSLLGRRFSLGLPMERADIEIKPSLTREDSIFVVQSANIPFLIFERAITGYLRSSKRSYRTVERAFTALLDKYIYAPRVETFNISEAQQTEGEGGQYLLQVYASTGNDHWREEYDLTGRLTLNAKCDRVDSLRLSGKCAVFMDSGTSSSSGTGDCSLTIERIYIY